jgi:bifunctional non-homologous end joining protein LigD
VSKRQEGGLVLWVFDLLFARGRDIRDKPYVERKRRLAKLVVRAKTRALRHSEFFADGDRLLGECGKRGLEGIVSKRRDSPYRSGKQTSWINVKCQAWREANRKRHKLFERGKSGTPAQEEGMPDAGP